MAILALDLGQNIGFFLGNPVGPCRWGSFELERTTDLGRWLRSSDPFLQQILPLASSIAIEQPFLGDSYWPARKLLALLGHVAWHSHMLGISGNAISEIPIATGKHTLTGSGRADKQAMIDAAAADGYVGLDEHAADAYGLFKVFVYGKRERIAKPKTRSSKGIVVKTLTEEPLNIEGVEGWKVRIA